MAELRKERFLPHPLDGTVVVSILHKRPTHQTRQEPRPPGHARESDLYTGCYALSVGNRHGTDRIVSSRACQRRQQPLPLHPCTHRWRLT